MEKEKLKCNYWIEVPGFLGLCSLFLAIWIDGYFWKFLGTGILFFVIATVNHKSQEFKNKTAKEKVE